MMDTPDTSLQSDPSRSRRRRGWWRAGVLLLVLVAFLAWLLTTPSGRDVVLGQLAARLPEGMTLQWSRAEGVLIGTLSLHDVHYAQALESGPLNITGKRLAVNPALWRLLRGQLHLNTLTLEQSVLTLPPPADEAPPFTLPQWRELLPEVHLPLTLAADAIELDEVSLRQQDASLIDIHTLRGGILARNGGVQVHDLHADTSHGRFHVDGHYQPRQHARTHLTVSARLPSARFGLAVRGDLDALEIALAGHAPERIEAHWLLRDAETWTLSAHSDGFNLATFTPGDAGPLIAFALDASGNAEASHWQGRVQQGDWSAILHPSTLSIHDQRLDIGQWQLDIAHGAQFKARFQLDGHAQFSPDHRPQFQLTASTQDGIFSHAAIALTSTLELNGQFDAWQAQGRATATRAGEHASLTLHVQGDARSARLSTLNVRTPSGPLAASGYLTWAPALNWDLRAELDGVDPGYFAPDWPGAVNARLSSSGHTHADGSVRIDAHLRELGGHLRQRALSGMAQFSVNSARQSIQGNADLGLGASRIQATANANANANSRLDIEAAFSPLRLADLWPEAEGEIQGRFHLTGTRAAPDLAAALRGDALRWGDYRLTRLNASGHLPWQQGEGALDIELDGIETGIVLDHIGLNLTGSAQRLQLSAKARAPALSITTRASVETQRNTTHVSLNTLTLTPATGAAGAAWQLQAPVEITWDGPRWTLAHSCLTSTDHARLCASGEWPQTGVQLEARALPLLLLSPWLQTLLPEYSPGQPWVLRGQIDLDAHARPQGQRWQGALKVHSQSGRLLTHAAAARDVVSYQDLALSADFDPEHLRARLDTLLPDSAHTDADNAAPGHLRAQLASGWDPHAPVHGDLTLLMRDLTWLELFSADLANPGGQFSAELQLTGTRTAPNLVGHARLHEITAELPALALHLQQGEITVSAQSGHPARFNGQLHSGEGALTVRGELDWRVPELPLNLHLVGENLTASNTRDLKLTIAPDLSIESTARQPLRVSGSIHVPSALLDLERLDSGVPISPDVVVIDPAKPAHTSERSALQMDLTLIMGEHVRLRGFGLDGRLGGELRLHAEPGHEMTGSGRLDVSGGYKAYGQALTITRAQLEFTNGPLTDPLVEMSAERKIALEDMTAGLTVTGRASAPEVTVWTNPPTDSSQALSWLAFGRSLSSLSSLETQEFNAAATALSAGGDLLAKQIAGKIGLDDAGLSTSRTLGESVLGVGKQISPRLYVGVGVSILGNGQMLTLKYLLRKGFDVEIESSTEESRGSVNWRHESD